MDKHVPKGEWVVIEVVYGGEYPAWNRSFRSRGNQQYHRELG
jgi:hypothetical protein